MNEQDNQREPGRVFVGLDVHRDTISACVLDTSTGEILLDAQLKNQPAAVARLIKRIRSRFGEPRCCYEASSCGFVLFRLLRDLRVECDVIGQHNQTRIDHKERQYPCPKSRCVGRLEVRRSPDTRSTPQKTSTRCQPDGDCHQLASAATTLQTLPCASVP